MGHPPQRSDILYNYIASHFDSVSDEMDRFMSMCMRTVRLMGGSPAYNKSANASVARVSLTYTLSSSAVARSVTSLNSLLPINRS